MNFKYSVFLIAFLGVTHSASCAETDPQAAGTGYYYFLGKINECLSNNEISYMRDEGERSELLHETSRGAIYDKASKSLKNTKPQDFDEALDVWLRRSARYEEGVDSIRSILKKDIFMNIDECNLLLPYIRLNIIKKPKDGDMDYPDDGNMDNAYKTWEEIK